MLVTDNGATSIFSVTLRAVTMISDAKLSPCAVASSCAAAGDIADNSVHARRTIARPAKYFSLVCNMLISIPGYHQWSDSLKVVNISLSDGRDVLNEPSDVRTRRRPIPGEI